MGDTHSADSANGLAQVRPIERISAELGRREGESKWVLGGIAVGIVGHKQWNNLVNDNMSIGHTTLGAVDEDHRHSRPEMSDRKLAIEMNHRLAAVVLDAGIVDDGLPCVAASCLCSSSFCQEVLCALNFSSSSFSLLLCCSDKKSQRGITGYWDTRKIPM